MTDQPDLYQIRGHFTAGIEVKNDIVLRAAPIMNYMEGWKIKKVIEYVQKRRWTIQRVKETL